jgi:Tfp pilus assembly protein PilN
MIGLGILLFCGLGFLTFEYYTFVISQSELEEVNQQITMLKPQTRVLFNYENEKNKVDKVKAEIEKIKMLYHSYPDIYEKLALGLPENVWLTLLESKAEILKIEGKSSSLTGISIFINNMSGVIFIQPN